MQYLKRFLLIYVHIHILIDVFPRLKVIPLSTSSFTWLANILQKYFRGKFEDLSANLLNRLKMCQQFQIEMYSVFLFNKRYTIKYRAWHIETQNLKFRWSVNI